MYVSSFHVYGYQVGEKEKCNSNCSLLGLTNTFGLLSRPCPIILTKADAGPNKFIANTTPHSTSCIQHISTCLFHKKALQGSSQLWAGDHCIGTRECKHQSPVTFYTIRSPSAHNCSSISVSTCYKFSHNSILVPQNAGYTITCRLFVYYKMEIF